LDDATWRRFTLSLVKTIVYVDGFNLYYGGRQDLCGAGAGWRWLDLQAFSQRMLPRDNIVGIKYFTALVTPRPGNPDAKKRQQAYIRALETLPHLRVYYGRFLTSKIYAARVHPPKVGKKKVQVWKTEEKGSDVNLATELLVDGFKGDYELAVVISNDGDLKHPIEYVRETLGKPVGVLNPRKKRSYALSPPKLARGSFYKPIRAGVIRASQFPATLKDLAGTITKPPAW
jgi:hypothetical protein